MNKKEGILHQLVNALVRLGWAPLYVHDVMTDTDYSWKSFVKVVGDKETEVYGEKGADPLFGLEIVCREGVLTREVVQIQRRYWEPLHMETKQANTEPFPAWRLRRKLI